MTAFSDKPWRPADHPRPGPSWRAEPRLLEVLEPNDRFLLHQGSGVTSMASLPGLPTADRVGDSAGIIPEVRA
jgi:hypothetical protein